MPINKTDASAMLHDIDYLRFSGDDEALSMADTQAISNFEYTPAGILGKTGLFLRKSFNLPFTPTDNHFRNRKLGEQLRKKVLNDPEYSKILNKYELKWNW